MISVGEALDTVLRDLPRLGAQQVGLLAARDRVLAAPQRASRDVPPFRNSAMDGYAVRAADLAGANAATPVRLRILEVIGAGAVPTRIVGPGSATKIMTGSTLPAGADAVVRVEDTEDTHDDGADWVRVRASVAVAANVREIGEDLRAGDTVLRPGRRLRPADIGLLASLGVASVPVRRRPRVAILATGDELVDVGEPLGPGQIVNSNAYTLAAAIEEVGGEPIMLGIARDEPGRIRTAFEDAFAADVVLSTGGVSVGTFDFVRRILGELGYQERFWKVAQKPGKPLTFGLRDGVPTFGLPGNPVSSLVCFYLYVVPALRTMLGLDEVFLPSVSATVTTDVTTAAGLTEFVRCVVDRTDDGYTARPTGSQSSGVLSSLSAGDGLLIAPPDLRVIARGERARVILLRGDGVTDRRPF